ncbi:MAG: HD domain-containing phosphohydrolase [Erysipelotrichaceae bacterium]
MKKSIITKTQSQIDEAKLREKATVVANKKIKKILDKTIVAPISIKTQIEQEISVYLAELEVQKEELLSARNELEKQHLRYLNLFNSGPLSFVVLTNKGLIEELNSAAETILESDSRRLKSMPFTKFIHHDDQDIYYLGIKKLIETGETMSLELKLNRSNQPFWVALTAVISNDIDPKPVIWMIINDINKRKDETDQISYLSYHDQLTGLYNRRFFEEELRRLDTKRNLPLSIAIGDVNGLKLINDSFGHEKGDELLTRATKVFRTCCRTDDIITRLGGDEFVILLPQTDETEANKVIERIIQQLNKEQIGVFKISISFGCATKNIEEKGIEAVFAEAEELMYRNKLLESTSVRSSNVDLIMATLFEKSQREMFHSRRVGLLCELIAKQMNLSKDKINQVKLAGMMHDIGKIGIEDSILNSPIKLDDDQIKMIKKHSETGYRILSSSIGFKGIAQHVLEHHEKWDGTGYPKGIAGEKISMAGRIIGIADAFDAMTNMRPYGVSLSIEEAVKELKRCASTQFDPNIVAIFIDKVLPIYRMSIDS